MHPYNVGIVGYGGFGPFLHQALDAMREVRVVAVADAARSCNSRDVRFFPDWRALVSDAKIDIVAVVTPPATHADIACAALEAGKHVVVEKPVATKRADALRIIAARDRTTRVATVDFMLRYNPVVEAIHAWCQSKCFGHLRRVSVENYAQDESLGSDHWFWNRAVSGGILVEHAGHFFDVVQGCAQSAPVRVDGLRIRRNPDREDRVMATVVHENGLISTHYHAFSRPGFFEHTSMRFVFDLAELDVEGWIPRLGSVRAIVSQRTQDQLSRLPGFTVREKRALDAVRNESRPEGWGGEPGGTPSGSRVIRSGGERYAADALVLGSFAMTESKAEAYSEALRALVADVVKGIDDPTHRLRVTLEDGLASLDIALEAGSQP